MNKAMLIGNIGQEPEVRYYDKDQCVARVRLATTERGYTLTNGTKVPDRTDWHNVIFYHGLAKVVEKYVHKGDKIFVEGRLRYRSYDDKKGLRRYVTEIYAENMELLTPKRAQERAGEQSVPGVRTDGMADEGSSAGEPAVDESNGLPF